MQNQIDGQNTAVAMSGNVQGFELPRGCFFVSGAIVIAIITVMTGFIYIL